MKRVDQIVGNDSDTARLLNKVLTLYYVEELTQTQIADQLGLSTAKVNRMIQQARKQGLVDITIRTPFQHLFELESRLKAVFSLQDAIVIPSIPEGATYTSYPLGRAAATFLLEHLKEGEIIAIGSGASVHAVVQAIEAPRDFGVTVVPLVGAVQGQVTSDVNYLAVRLAERLGGKAYQLHAPAFVDTRDHRETLLMMRPVREILDIARQAKVALLGVGVLDRSESRFVQFTALSPEDMDRIIQVHRGVGDIAAHVFDIEGRPTALEYSDRVIGLTLEELKRIPLTIGVAATAAKALPLYGALRGNYLQVLITDEAAALGVLDLFDRDFRKEL